MTRESQETIQMMRSDTYLADLRRMVAQGRTRNDPTLAIAVSIEALGGLLDTLDSLTAERAELAKAAARLANAAESLSYHAKHADDEAHRSWFRPAIGDVDREVELTRAALSEGGSK